MTMSIYRGKSPLFLSFLWHAPKISFLRCLPLLSSDNIKCFLLIISFILLGLFVYPFKTYVLREPYSTLLLLSFCHSQNFIIRRQNCLTPFRSLSHGDPSVLLLLSFCYKTTPLRVLLFLFVFI